MQAVALASALVLAFALGLTSAVAAPQISLNGSLGTSTALLVVDGKPQNLRVGQTLRSASGDVTLLELRADGPVVEALVEANGQRLTLSLGRTPVAAGGNTPGTDSGRVVLQADRDGHFLSAGSIGGKPVRFMVDTGASSVALSQQDAERIGLNYRSGRRIGIQTANGRVEGWQLTIDRVRLGDVEISGVSAVVSAAPMPFVLLGNSYLSRFRLLRENDRLVLERRY